MSVMAVARAQPWLKVQACQAQAMLRGWIRASDKTHVGWPEFKAACLQAGVPEDDCEKTLRRLEKSGSVVYSDGVVNLKPEAFFGEVWQSAGLKMRHRLDEEIAAIEEELKGLDIEKTEVDAKIEAWRRKMWTRTAAYCGAQMWLFARLTFVDFEWDIMEPVSWLVVQGNAVLFFAYLFRYGSEHSHPSYDETVLSKVSLRMYGSYDFDIRRWAHLKQKLTALRAERDRPLRIL